MIMALIPTQFCQEPYGERQWFGFGRDGLHVACDAIQWLRRIIGGQHGDRGGGGAHHCAVQRRADDEAAAAEGGGALPRAGAWLAPHYAGDAAQVSHRASARRLFCATSIDVYIYGIITHWHIRDIMYRKTKL